jgi:hypothetical protein
VSVVAEGDCPAKNAVKTAQNDQKTGLRGCDVQYSGGLVGGSASLPRLSDFFPSVDTKSWPISTLE